MDSTEGLIVAALKWGAGTMAALAAYIATQWRRDHNDLEERVRLIESTYADRKAVDQHVQQLRVEMRQGFDRVIDKLDGKADKGPG